MLSLQRKSGQKLLIGDKVLQILSIYTNELTISYNDQPIILRRGYMYELEPNTIICYNTKKSTEARLQITSPRKVLREELRKKQL